MDKNKLKPPEEWFRQARYDLDTANVMFRTGRYIYAVFMCHLCIEKALKGLYTQKLGECPPKIHNLIYLVKKLAISLSLELKEFITELNTVSVPTRYPDELAVLLKEYSKNRVDKIVKSTEEMLRCLRRKLKR